MAKTPMINSAQVNVIETLIAKVLAGGVMYREGRTTIALESPCMDKRKIESRGIPAGTLVTVGLGAYEIDVRAAGERATAYVEIHAGGYGDHATRILLMQDNAITEAHDADGWRLWGANFRDFTEEQANRWIRVLEAIAWEKMDAFVVKAREAVQTGDATCRPESNERTKKNPAMFRALEKLYARAKTDGSVTITAEEILKVIEVAAAEENAS